MKIACVATGWYPQTPGGLEKYVYGMTHALLRAGDAVDLFAVGDPHFEHARGRAYSIGHEADSMLKRLIAARRAFARSFSGPYDVLNLHFAMTALPLLPFIGNRTPRVVHFHGPWGAESRAEGGGSLSVSIKEALERYVYRSADRFVVLSGAFRDVLAGYGVDPRRINIIPMGIDTNHFVPAADRASARAELGWPGDRFVFFTARRLVNRVGMHELLRAAKLTQARHPDFVVKVAGKGPLRRELEDAIAALDLGDRVQLLGFVDEDTLVRAYQAADVTVLPTQSLEGFGTIISESLACGTPVIVTPVGGMPEAIAPLSPQAVAASASPEDIAERMSAALAGTLALPGAAECRAYALERFNWDVVYRQVRAVFAAAGGAL